MLSFFVLKNNYSASKELYCKYCLQNKMYQCGNSQLTNKKT